MNTCCVLLSVAGRLHVGAWHWATNNRRVIRARLVFWRSQASGTGANAVDRNSTVFCGKQARAPVSCSRVLTGCAKALPTVCVCVLALESQYCRHPRTLDTCFDTCFGTCFSNVLVHAVAIQQRSTPLGAIRQRRMIQDQGTIRLLRCEMLRNMLACAWVRAVWSGPFMTLGPRSVGGSHHKISDGMVSSLHGAPSRRPFFQSYSLSNRTLGLTTNFMFYLATVILKFALFFPCGLRVRLPLCHGHPVLFKHPWPFWVEGRCHGRRRLWLVASSQTLLCLR